jgi:hypothetical protein
MAATSPSGSGGGGGHPMTESAKGHVMATLSVLKKLPPANVLMDDPVGTLDRYTVVIAKPMWFGLIQTRLMSSVYATVEAFVADVQLMYTNCLVYNYTPNEPVWTSAESALLTFYSSAVFKQLQLPSPLPRVYDSCRELVKRMCSRDVEIINFFNDFETYFPPGTAVRHRRLSRAFFPSSVLPMLLLVLPSVARARA